MSLLIAMVLALVGADAPATEAAVDTQPDPDAGKIVATVETRQITVESFIDAYKNRLANVTPDKYPPMKTTGKARTFLEDLITIQAILVSAVNDGYDKHPEFLRDYQSFEENILIQALMVVETKDLVVTEGDAREFYDKSKMIRIVRYIMSDSLANAQKASAEARKKSADFAKLAASHSTDKESAANGGELGRPLQYWPQEPFLSIFNLPLNTASDPIQLPEEVGWGVFLVEKEQPNPDIQPWDEVKDYFINQLKEIRTNQIREQLADSAFRDAKVERNQQNMDILYTGETTPEDWAKDEIANLVVSSVDGLPITFREWYSSAIFYLNNIGNLRKEEPDHLRKAMEYQLKVMEKGKALISLCFKRKINELPDAAEALHNYRDRELTFAYLKENIEDKIPAPTEEQINAYYEKHKNEAEYLLVESLDATILRGNKKEYVDEAISRLGKGEEKDAVILDVNKRAGVVNMGKPGTQPVLDVYVQNFLSTNTEQKDQYDTIKNLGDGNWSESMERDGSFYAARLEKVNPARIKTLEEARNTITSIVSDEIHLDPKTDKMCRDLLKKIHDRYPVKVFNDVLELARKKAAALPLPKPRTEEGMAPQSIELK